MDITKLLINFFIAVLACVYDARRQEGKQEQECQGHEVERNKEEDDKVNFEVEWNVDYEAMVRELVRE